MRSSHITTDPVLLILDKCSSHHNIQKDGITIIFLPSNVTSTSQPLDQGIISTVKRNYRIIVLKKITQNMELYMENTKK